MVATSRPSTADSTEIAGVIMPSPYSSAAPNRPSMTSIIGCARRQVVRVDAVGRLVGRWPRRRGRATSAISASTPPSPSLSARMTKSRYLTETTSVSDQKTSDRMPKMFAGDGRHAVGQRHALLDGVERRGADVAVDDAEGAQRQLGKVDAVRRFMVV